MDPDLGLLPIPAIRLKAFDFRPSSNYPIA